jgi:hypothetical protein
MFGVQVGVVAVKMAEAAAVVTTARAAVQMPVVVVNPCRVKLDKH